METKKAETESIVEDNSAAALLNDPVFDLAPISEMLSSQSSDFGEFYATLLK